ncbi:Putative phosphoenolpyruvate synthase (Putative PEP synthase) (Pyruvate [Durusdinium trenchii]|uniref:Water dikinase n=1 Tax=Durusdinium trenchii TaxID=1381693 RepID=A0ABP0K0R2_9DINO
MIIPLSSAETKVDLAGGKGAALAKLIRSQVPVPSGFLVGIDVYATYLAENGIAPRLPAMLAGIAPDDLSELEAASRRIRSEFSSSRLSDEAVRAIGIGYCELRELIACDEPPLVAVRSSATCEDGPELSFAGQYETYLNVQGEAELLEAVVKCWSSLWTSRAISYRLRNGVSHDGLSIAVVVQQMVQADVSGVLFTANPLTGRRSEMVIDATRGNGDDYVSGQSNPERYIIDRVSRRTLAVDGVTCGEPLLDEERIERLRIWAERIEEIGRLPQDIEWSFAGDQISILQARPITSLFPLPDVAGASPTTWISVAAIQGLSAPLTPLGRDVCVKLANSFIRSLFGTRGSDTQHGEMASPDVLDQAGERLWVNLDTLARTCPLGRFDQYVEDLLGRVTVPSGESLSERLRSVVTYLRTSPAEEFPSLLLAFVRMITPAAISLRLLAKLCGDQALALETTRSLAGNVTVEMDLALWNVAQTIATNREARHVFAEESAEEIAQRYIERTLPSDGQAALARFLDLYGMRCVGEIDVGQSRWREDPTQIIRSIKSYLSLPPEAAPDIQVEYGKRAAVVAEEQIVASVGKQSCGWLKQRLARAAARRVRLLMGARETPKFAFVQLLGVGRAALRDIGVECVAAGYLQSSDDVVFLHLDELEMLASELAADEEAGRGSRRNTGNRTFGAVSRDWNRLVAERRNVYRREQRRRRIPRVLVSDGRTFYDNVAAEESNGHGLRGVPVSPGVVEGKVRIVLDPRDCDISVGEILVCPGTDPAWTPMFMVASGLVTEVGGVMAHGSVVARECGIPAVVGVRDATTRLQNGQQVRIDGTTGTIMILEGDAAREQVAVVL